MGISDLTAVSNLGLAGVALYMMWKLATNHVEHSTKAMNDLRDAVIELIAFLKAREGK